MILRKAAGIAVVVSVLTLATTGCSSTPAEPPLVTGSDSAAPGGLDDLDAATLAYLKANAEALAEQYGIPNPPDVQPIRLITLQEYASTQVPCLQKAGFEAAYTEDGEGVSYPPITDPALQQSLFLAIYTCELQYPVQQRYYTPLTDAGLKALYEYRTGDLVQCLKDEGYDLASDPPSETVFVQNGGDWSPFEGLAIAPQDLKQVYADCPQTRDDIYGT